MVWRAASSTLDAAGLASTWAVVNVLAGLEIACLALAEVLARVGGGMAAAAKHRRCRLAECCRAGSPGWCEATSRGAVGPQPAQPQTESEKGVHAKAACEKGHMVNGTPTGHGHCLHVQQRPQTVCEPVDQGCGDVQTRLGGQLSPQANVGPCVPEPQNACEKGHEGGHTMELPERGMQALRGEWWQLVDGGQPRTPDIGQTPGSTAVEKPQTACEKGCFVGPGITEGDSDAGATGSGGMEKGSSCSQSVASSDVSLPAWWGSIVHEALHAPTALASSGHGRSGGHEGPAQGPGGGLDGSTAVLGMGGGLGLADEEPQRCVAQRFGQPQNECQQIGGSQAACEKGTDGSLEADVTSSAWWGQDVSAPGGIFDLGCGAPGATGGTCVTLPSSDGRSQGGSPALASRPFVLMHTGFPKVP